MGQKIYNGSHVFVFYACNDGLSKRGKLQCQSTQISPTRAWRDLKSIVIKASVSPLFIMSWFEIICVVILGGLFWLWFDSTRVHEIAVECARSQCHVDEVQFLDDTVALATIKPARDEDGRLVLKRTYTFEYSDTGNNRQPGSIIMLGEKVQFLGISPRLVGADISLH